MLIPNDEPASLGCAGKGVEERLAGAWEEYNTRGEHLNENAKLAAASGAKPTASSNPFMVKVTDNFHPYDEDDVYTKGVYASYDLALVVAKQVVVESLLHLATQKPGISGAKLYECYRSFGEDPFIVGAESDYPRFSAWSYAKSLCDSLRPRVSAPAAT